MCKKCTSNFYINTKNVQTVQNLYKVQTKNGLKLEMCFCIQTMYKLHKTYTTSSLKLHLYVFCTYTQCTNYTKCIPMLIESYMQLLMYVFCICNNPIFLNFCINNDAIFHSILQLCEISGPIFSYSKRFI